MKHQRTKPTPHPEPPLCPAQRRALDQLSAGLEIGTLVCLRSGIGLGKTTLLKTLHQRIGGVLNRG